MAFSRNYTSKPITDIFTSDTNINRRECHRVVPMKVLVLGLGRTGTTSMRAALRQLGYVDTYHMMNASVENPPDCLMWQDAFAAKYDGIGKFTREDWDQLLGHCQALCDWPASAFAKELIEAYPNAKVVLIGRDLDSWHASTMKTVWWRVCDPELRIASYVSWGASMYYPMLKKFFDTFFEGDFPNKGKEIYKRHYKEVRDMVPPENLLEYQISDGWGPLCDFLGEDIPCVKFPRCNDTAGFKERCRWRNRMQMCNAALRFALYGGILLGGLYALSRAYKSFSA